MKEPGGKWHLPRKDPRAATDVVVEAYHADAKTLRGICRLLDLSISGACVESTSDWVEGEEVVIRVLLDTRTLLKLPAKVIWKRLFAKTHHYGLRFNDYSEKNRAEIAQFVKDFEARLSRMGPKLVFKA